MMRLSFTILFLAVVFAAAQEPVPSEVGNLGDSTTDSTAVYLQQLTAAADSFAAAESLVVSPTTRRGERESLLAYWQATGALYAAQAAYLAYTGDRVGAYLARKARDLAVAKSYAYLPSEEFKPTIGGRHKLQG